MTTPYTFEALVVGLHLPWSGVWQRPNHILTRLAKLTPVIVVEEPYLASEDSDVVVEHNGITVLSPQRRTLLDAVDARAIAGVTAWLAGRNPAVWLYSPMLFPLAAAFPSAPLVYDKMDQLSAFLAADPRLDEREAATLERAAVVFAGGESLWNTVRGRARRGLPLSSGVDVAHFAGARGVPPHPRTHAIATTAIRLCRGHRRAARSRAHRASRRSTARCDGRNGRPGSEDLTRIAPAQIEYRLPRATLYAELPALLGAFDVALMPFAAGPATEFISPTKTLEYLAAELPVVSTPIADVVAGFSDTVRIAAGSDAFIAAVALAQREPLFGRDAAAERVARATWDTVVTRMLAELRSAQVSRSRRLPLLPYARP